MNLSEKYASRHPQVISQEIEDETLVLKLDSGRMGVLNSVGATVWDLMDGTRSLDDIVTQCAEVYQVDRERVEEDVKHYVQSLLERDMIVFD